MSPHLWPGLLAFLDWPQFLGPARNAIYPGNDVKWPTAVAWSRPVGHGVAGPAIADGKVTLFHRRKLRQIVDAFDHGPRSSPTVAENAVYS